MAHVQGLKDEARAVWRAGTATVQPLTSRYLRQAALFEKKERNWAAAAALFSDAVRRDPQDYRSWLQWAVFERRQRNYEAAERCFQQGTAVAPGYPYLWCVHASNHLCMRVSMLFIHLMGVHESMGVRQCRWMPR